MSTVYFYSDRVGPHRCFSNFYPCEFVLDGVTYPSSEHALMAAKAKLMGDDAARAKILRTSTPAGAKRVGRTVRNWDEELWKSNRLDIMTRILVAKFSNRHLKPILTRTGNSTIAEAAAGDRIWGIGLNAHHARSGKPWRGQNLLGQALMKARSNFM